MKSKLLLLLTFFIFFDGFGQIGFEEHVVIDNSYSALFPIYTSSQDIDGDGDMDVISASRDDNKIAWYENIDGQGNFGIQQIITNDSIYILSVYAEDIDGDGDIDILCSSLGDGKIAWYENIDGLGTFSDEKIIVIDLNGPTSIFAGDMDGDGDHDIISNESNDSRLIWYENIDGQGNFGVEHIITDVADSGNKIFISDLDGDGDNDVLSASSTSDKIVWYENMDNQNNFGSEQVISVNVNGTQSIYAGDIDEDGDIDVLSAASLDDKVAWYENLNGQATSWSENIITTNQDGVHLVLLSDIDTDGDMDVISGSLGDDDIVWYKNLDGVGNFDSKQVIETLAPSSIFTSNLDGDGNLDLISSFASKDEILWYKNMDGQGSFDAQQSFTPFRAIEPTSVYTSDLDGDGDLDILSASREDDKVAWYENIDGQGNFGMQQTITIDADRVWSVYAEDIDGDGDMDVISASQYDSKIAWYENTDGLGNFGSQQIISTDGDFVTCVFAVDLDNDGDIDILSSSVGDNEVSWYENIDGQGNFIAKPKIASGIDVLEPWSVFATDIDNDGDMDVLSASRNDDKIAWYENTDGEGNFSSQQIIATDADGAFDVFAADIDGDGDMDMISGTWYLNKVAWNENLGLVTNQIKGTITSDINVNGCDINDALAPNVKIKTDNGTQSIITFSLNNGFYQMFPHEGSYTTSISLPNYFIANPPSQVSDFVGFSNTDIVDFCLEPNQLINDLNITLLPLSEARPGFDATYQLVYHNVGTTQLNGTTTVEFDDTKLNFLTASQPPTSQNNNTLTFDFENLNPFETRTIDLTFSVLPPPTVNIDDLLNFTATINPIAGDFTEDDNQFTFDQTVIGSYDPNDIRVLEGEEVLIENADQYLHYIIRFQNTGTADAINVRVENILDDKLDWNTIQLESYSHPNRVEIKDGDKVSFIFDGIYLPDSTTNEPESHGFIAYKIKPKSDIQIGDIISNKADIFFDFNTAVETNTVMTEIVDPTSIEENTQLQFSIFPIPTSGILSIQSESTITQIEIYDQLGQLVLTESNSTQIDLSSLNRGFYFCKVRNENGEAGIKKVVKE